MRGSIWGGLALVTAALAMPVLGQTGGDQTASSEDAPNKDQKQHYTAELKMTTVRTLSNGTTITLESTMVMAVDSQGRSMNSNTDMWEPGGQKPFTRVTAYDPVAGTQTVWTSPGLQAIVTTLLPQPPVKSSQSGCFLFYKTATNPTTGAKTALPAPGIAVQLTGTAMKSSSGPAGLGIE